MDGIGFKRLLLNEEKESVIVIIVEDNRKTSLILQIDKKEFSIEPLIIEFFDEKTSTISNAKDIVTLLA